MRATHNLLVVDVETTCSTDEAVPRREMEVIEIGAVMVDAEHFATLGEFHRLVRPVRHRRLTPFCRQLTSLKQKDVDSASMFTDVLAELVVWAQGFGEFAVAAWGNFDKNQLAQDCAHHLVAYPFPEPHVNLKAEFARHQGLARKVGVVEALRLARLEFEGAAHRALDDARNLARLLPFIAGAERAEASERPA
jgi:inhibitor of KinA sporulation pathway (predicted exonuclease)